MALAVVLSAWGAGCAVELAVPEQTEISCTQDADCPAGWRCNPASTRCTVLTGNRPPSVVIGAIERSLDSVAIPATVFDPEGDEVTLAASVMTAGVTAPITLDTSAVRGSIDGVAVTLHWDAQTFFLGSTALRDGLTVQLTPADDHAVGAKVSSEPFAFGNDPPALLGLESSASSSVAGGVITLRFTVVDSSSDRVSLASFEVSHTGDFVDAEQVPLDELDFPSSSLEDLATSPAGEAHSVFWDTGLTAPVHGEVSLRLTVSDGRSDSALSEPLRVHLDNSPALELGAVVPVTGTRFIDSVILDFVVQDPSPESVAVRFEYCLDSDPLSAAATWYPASRDDGTNVMTIAPEERGLPQTYEWLAGGDALRGRGLGYEWQDTTGDGVAERTVTAYTPRVVVRATPVDSTSLEGAAVLSRSFALGDDAPVITLAELQEPQSGESTLAFDVFDSAADAAAVEVQFSTPGDDCAWRTARVGRGSIDALASGPVAPGVQHLLTWLSQEASLGEDCSSPQGLGAGRFDDVQVRVRAVGDPSAALPVFSAWSTITVRVVNQTPPRVEVLYVKTDGDLRTGNIPIVYRLVDDERDPVDIKVEVTTDNGESWATCAELASPLSEGTRGLAVARSGDPSGSGVHTFVWDSRSDIFGYSADCRLRITASDGFGPGAAVEALPVSEVGHPTGAEAGFGFAAPVPYLSGGAQGLATADLDEDGVPDLVVGNGAQVAVLLGNDTGGIASGTFADPLFYAGPNNGDIWSFAVDDFNEDGVLDMVGADRTNIVVAVWLGGGAPGAWDQTFSPQADVLLPARPRSLAAGDIDGDGNLDLVVATDLTGEQIYLGDGAGGFTMSSYVYDGQSYCMQPAVGLADLNGDQRPDLVVGCDVDPKVRIGFASGAGFTGWVFPDISDVAQYRAAVGFGDLNEDGLTDVVTAYDQGVDVILATAPGAFATPVSYRNNGMFNTANVAVADFTGDGLLDVATSDEMRDAVNIGVGGRSSGLCDGTLRGPVRVGAGTLYNAKWLTAGDFNADGRADLAVNGDGDSMHVILSAPPRQAVRSSVSAPHSFITMGSTWTLGSAAADLNDDGVLDVVTDGDTLFGRRAGTGLGSGAFDVVPHDSWSGWIDIVFFLDCADLDHDGVPDCIARFQNSTAVMMGTSVSGAATGGFAEPVLLDEMATPTAGLVADLNGDGELDLFFCDYGTQAMAFLGDGAGAFTELMTWALPGPSISGQIAAGDFNADRLPEMAIPTERGLVVLYPTRDGSLEPAVSISRSPTRAPMRSSSSGASRVTPSPRRSRTASAPSRACCTPGRSTATARSTCSCAASRPTPSRSFRPA